MAKDSKTKNDKIKHIYLILVTSLLVLGAGWKVYGHFAKTTALEVVARAGAKGREAAAKSFVWIEERLAIGTHDQRVHRQKEAVERAKNRVRFKENDDEPTVREVEDVKIQEVLLKEAEQERTELIEQYKSKK